MWYYSRIAIMAYYCGPWGSITRKWESLYLSFIGLDLFKYFCVHEEKNEWSIFSVSLLESLNNDTSYFGNEWGWRGPGACPSLTCRLTQACPASPFRDEHQTFQFWVVYCSFLYLKHRQKLLTISVCNIWDLLFHFVIF